MTLIEMVKKSLLLIGAITPNQTLSADEALTCVAFANDIADLWSASGLLSFASTQESFSLVAGQSLYAWGQAGGEDFNSQRPVKVTNAFIRDGINDFPCDLIDQNTWDSIGQKTDSGRPFALFYNATFPSGTCNFYFVPDKAYTVFLDSDKDLIDFTNLTAEILLPYEYQAAFVPNLARDLAPTYKIPVPGRVEAMAEESLRILKRLNATNSLKPIRQNLFPGKTGNIWVYGPIEGGLPSD